MLDRIEIRPSKRATIAKFVALEALLIPASLYAALRADDLVAQGAGVFGLVFFGLGGIIAVAAMATRTWSFAIGNDGIEINGNGLPLIGTRRRRLSWRDVEAVGIANVAGQKMVGLRLSSHEAYLTDLDGPRKRRALRRLLQVNRSLCAYDVCFPWSDLDRPSGDMVDLLMRYRRAAMPGTSI